MFGYINPDKPNMLMKDFALYRAYYCGMCKCTGGLFGQLSRFTTNYDIAFLSAFCHDYLDVVPNIYQGTCILNPIKKKDICASTPLMERLAAVNVIIFYYKLMDDIADKNPAKKAALVALKRAYFKAKKIAPNFDSEMDTLCKALEAAQKTSEGAFDKMCHFPALMPVRAVQSVFTPDFSVDENVETLAYNIGKFVYLADALDDYDEDKKKGNFNPLVSCFANYKSKVELVQNHRADLEFLFNTTINSACTALRQIKKGHSHGVVDNIVFRGLAAKSAELLSSPKKLKPPRL